MFQDNPWFVIPTNGVVIIRTGAQEVERKGGAAEITESLKYVQHVFVVPVEIDRHDPGGHNIIGAEWRIFFQNVHEGELGPLMPPARSLQNSVVEINPKVPGEMNVLFSGVSPKVAEPTPHI